MRNKLIYLLPVITFFVGIGVAKMFLVEYTHEDAVKIYACGRAQGEVIGLNKDIVGCRIDGKDYEFGHNTSATSTSEVTEESSGTTSEDNLGE